MRKTPNRHLCLFAYLHRNRNTFMLPTIYILTYIHACTHTYIHTYIFTYTIFLRQSRLCKYVYICSDIDMDISTNRFRYSHSYWYTSISIALSHPKKSSLSWRSMRPECSRGRKSWILHRALMGHRTTGGLPKHCRNGFPSNHGDSCFKIYHRLYIVLRFSKDVHDGDKKIQGGHCDRQTCSDWSKDV